MFDEGGELLYVGARGTWYPNAGPMFTAFDLTFEYPEDWTRGGHRQAGFQHRAESQRASCIW